MPRRVSYSSFAEALDSDAFFDARLWNHDDAFCPPGEPAAADAATQGSPNPICPPLPPPAEDPVFDPEAVDVLFRESLVAKHETVAASWIALNGYRERNPFHPRSRDGLSYEDLAAGIRNETGDATDLECRAIYVLYVGASAAAKNEKIPFAAFARRFAAAGALNRVGKPRGLQCHFNF